MKIAIFLGSSRVGRRGEFVAEWIKKSTETRGHEVFLIDPKEQPELETFNSRFKNIKSPSEKLKEVQKIVEGADAFILITPEYNHGYSGTLKNMIDCFVEEYARKCFGIVTYSTNLFGGIRAGEQLRNVCSELGGVSIPKSLAIGNLQEVIENGFDSSHNERIEKFLEQLEWFGDALNKKRES